MMVSMFRKAPTASDPQAVSIEVGEFNVRLYDRHREGRTDGLSALSLTPDPASFEVVPVIGETVTITFRVTGIERQER